MVTIIVACVSVAVLAILAFVYFRSNSEVKALRARLAGITDLDAELATAKQKITDAKADLDKFLGEDRLRRAQLTEQYKDATSKYEALTKEINLLEENLEDISFGLYKPHFTYASSDDYKQALQAVRDRERDLIRNGRAAVCGIQWTIGDSKADGKRMTKQYLKLMLRAFNGECDAAVSNVSWNNITKMEERIRKAFEALNETGTVMQMRVTQEYLELKLNELRLTHECEEKRYQEKEEQRRAREEMREQEKAERELRKAQEDAERSETEYQQLLAKAREEAQKATGAQLEKLTSQVASFEAKLDEARKQKERAIARAQLTKSGFVYVISNIGAFGEHVFKIGMTRRMEPMDRVNELGDASVPFPYDVHVMFFSDNAPELESALHQLFEDRRVNLVNPRREFYQNVTLEEIEQFVKAKGLSAQIMKIPEAKEYRESLAIRAQRQASLAEQPNKFPNTLFAGAN